MALINRSIPNVYNGVSQQPPSLRLPSQAEEQINGVSSVVYGLTKRPPTQHLAKINSLTNTDSFIHTINRDTNNQYVVVITNGDLKVYNLSGVEQTVSFPDGKSYLTATTPRTAFSAVTVADYTFIVNKTVTVKALDTIAGNYLTPVTVSSLANITAKTVSSITSSGTTATVTTSVAHGLKVGHKVRIFGCTQGAFNGVFTITAVPSTTTFRYVMEQTTVATATGTPAYVSRAVTLTTATAHGIVANDLVVVKGSSQTEYNGTYPVIEVASTTTLTYNLDADPSVATATGTITYDAVQTQYKGSKQKFTDLPTSPVDGDVWEVAGDSSNNFDNYYVKYESASGVWRETIKPGLLTSLDATTLPYRLVNNGGGSFTFSKITWDDRLVGDDTSASFPSFVGKRIADVFFHRNRLGFIADENVIFSRAGSFFNFFPETTTSVLDTDPVDVAVSHTKVAVLRHALAFNTSLMLFADQAQFQLTAKDILTPKTAVINVTTEFNINPDCKPTSASNSIFFAVNKGDFSSVKEYAVQALTYTNDASDVTAHCPKYVPKDLYKLQTSNLDEVVIGLSLQERNAVYVYKYYWASPEEKVQSAWSKFTLDSGSTILNADFIDTKLYLVIGRSDGMYLEVLDMQKAPDDLGFVVNLDQRVSVTGSYNSTTNETTWTLPYVVTGGSFKAVLPSDYTGQAGSILSLTVSGTNTVKATGDFTAYPVYIGRNYSLTYTFSPIYFKDEQKTAVPHYKIKIKNFDVLYSTTGYFTAEVTPKNRESFTYTFTGKQLGDVDLRVGEVTISTGKYRIPVFSDSVSTEVSIKSDSPLPVSIQAAEWEGVLVTKSKHI